jgi:DNA-binding beta-propeller fold protein YncE
MFWVRRIAVIAVAVAALVAAGYGQRELLAAQEAPRGHWWLLAGCAVAALTIELGRRWASAPRWPAAPAMLEVAAVAALLALGAWLRITGFDRVPAGMNHDAAWNGMYASYIRSGAAELTPYVSAAWGRETLFMYLIAAAQRWWGATSAAVQAASIAAGVAALLPVYLLGRELFGRAAGLTGLAFFAVSGWHWVFSRVGWRCVTVPPFETLALFFLWRALRRRGGAPLAWVGTGVFTAASIYTYDAGRIVPPMIAVLAVSYLVLHRDGARSAWVTLRDVALAVVAFAVVAAPMLWYAANNWVQFRGRAAHLLEGGNDQGLAANILTAMGMFNYRANGNDFFVREPLLEPLAGVLFVLGAAILLLRWRRASSQFVLAGFALSLLPGLLASPNGNRCITAMPFVYAMIGVGGAATARLAASLFTGAAARGVAVAVVALAFGQAAATTYGEYVGEGRRRLPGLSPEATAVGEYIGAFGADYRIYAVSDLWPEYTLKYLGYSHGNPLEPDIVTGRSLREIESRINRYGRKGLVLVADLNASGEEARRGAQRIFAESRLESVRATRFDGREVARAVVVEPRAASRTAPWSNLTRVLAVAPGESETSADFAGARCFEPLVSAGGAFSVRMRMMVPAPPSGDTALAVTSSCAPPAAAATFTISSQGLAIDGPRRVVLVEPSELQPGRWYDLGLLVDSLGNASAMIDGRQVELGRWDDRPRRIAGFAVAVPPGADATATALYVDDFAAVARAVSAQSPWWQVAPAAGDDAQTIWESFEGLPLGDVAGRPGWHGAAAGAPRWRIDSGPPGPGGVAVDATNAFDGGHGDGPGQFDEPMGVGIDAGGNIYVCERLNHRVQKFASDGTYLGEWGVLGDRPGEFREPLDLAVEGERVYVMDTWNTRLQVFDLTGNYLYQIGPDPILGKPRGIAVRDGIVYVANSGRDDILVFDAEGRLSKQFPPPGSSPLRQIVDLVVDSRGRIYVNNSQMNRLEVYSPAGERLGAIDVPGWSSEHLKEFYMTIDDDDVIYISDWDVHRLRRFRVDGTELPPIGPPMNRPSGIAVHGGRVVVAARGDNALRVFELPDAAP